MSARDDFDPEAIFTKLSEAGEYWADCQAAAEMYEENKKTVLAQLMNDLDGSTNAERERQALASWLYVEHLEAMVGARKEAYKARVRYDSLKVLAEMRRTQESTRRAEANLR